MNAPLAAEEQPIGLGEWRYPYSPRRNARQMALHRCPAQEILYGGAAGGGKSDALLAAGVMQCLLIPNCKVILFRRTYKMLEQEIIPRLLARLPKNIATYSKADHMFTFLHNGATFRLGYLDKARDIENYTGPEYCLILWDELTQFRRAQYVFMRSRLRMAGQIAIDMLRYGLKPRMIATTNPGGVGHGWCKRMWVDPAYSHPDDAVFDGGIETGEDLAGLRTMAYIPARATDNPFLDLRSYRRNLAGLDALLRRALEDGDWDILEGVRFSEFRRGLHVIEPEQIALPMIGYPRAVGVDYGLQAPFCALWGILIGDLVVVYRELYASNLTAEQQARLILEAEAPGERDTNRPIPVALDPSTWIRSPLNVIKPLNPDDPAELSIAWWYRKVLGSAVRKATNDRVAGWHLVDNGLRVHESETLPRLLITTACPNLIRTLPELLRSNVNAEDVASKPKQEDHACFVAGTMVTTVDGDRPIESIRVGDLVLTRQGFRQVTDAGMTDPAAPVGTVTFSNGRALTGTGNHPVFTPTGPVRLDTLRYPDKLIPCQPPNPSSSTASPFAASPTPRPVRSASISRPMALTANEVSVVSTKKSGRLRMGRSRPAITFTTPTTIRSTTTPRTWFASRPANTTRITPRTPRTSPSPNATSPSLVLSPPYGMAAMRDWPGIESTGKRPGTTGRPNLRSAPGVTRNTRRGTGRPRPGSVPTTVEPRRARRPVSTTNNGSALIAAPSSRSTVTPGPSPAPVSVARPFDPGQHAPVYNLTVEGVHEYYANGVLVSNCDALRYLLFQLVGGGNPRTTSNPVPLAETLDDEYHVLLNGEHRTRLSRARGLSTDPWADRWTTDS